MVAGLVEKDGGKGIKKQIPMKAFAHVEEIARVAAFLAGPDSSYMTGSLLTVDGGARAQARHRQAALMTGNREPGGAARWRC